LVGNSPGVRVQEVVETNQRIGRTGTKKRIQVYVADQLILAKGYLYNISDLKRTICLFDEDNLLTQLGLGAESRLHGVPITSPKPFFFYILTSIPSDI